MYSRKYFALEQEWQKRLKVRAKLRVLFLEKFFRFWKNLNLLQPYFRLSAPVRFWRPGKLHGWPAR
jgi:hypothetical protein